MTLEMLMQDNYDQGVADEKARAEAKAKEEKAQNIRNFYFQGLSVENIAKGFSISEDEVKRILSVK